MERSDTHLLIARKRCQVYYRVVTDYRRNFVPGGSFFFTVNLADRRSRLLTQRIDLLRRAFRYARGAHPFTLDAIVVLPDHLHTMWTLPPDDSDFANRWRLIKTEFSRALKPNQPASPSRSAKGEREIWQRRYWEHTLRDDADFQNHCDYIRFNPVKHGYVTSANAWPFSSFKRFVSRGEYPTDWGANVGFSNDRFGER